MTYKITSKNKDNCKAARIKCVLYNVNRNEGKMVLPLFHVTYMNMKSKQDNETNNLTPKNVRSVVNQPPLAGIPSNTADFADQVKLFQNAH